MDASARFRALYAEAYPALRRWAHHRGIPGADADDVVAEVFTIAWRRFDDIPADAAIPWLYGVARNVVRNHRRGERRRAALALVAPPAAPGRHPTNRPTRALLRAALDSLDATTTARSFAWSRGTALTPARAGRRAGLFRRRGARAPAPRPPTLRRRGNARRDADT